jgi:hypothetical protein
MLGTATVTTWLEIITVSAITLSKIIGEIGFIIGFKTRLQNPRQPMRVGLPREKLPAEHLTWPLAG